MICSLEERSRRGSSNSRVREAAGASQQSQKHSKRWVKGRRQLSRTPGIQWAVSTNQVSLKEPIIIYLFLGDGSYKEAIKQNGAALAGVAYEKGGEIATGAYQSASYAKHAALDWITSMTNYEKKDDGSGKQAC